MEKVFISYCHKDAKFVDRLTDDLSRTFNIWLDRLSVLPGKALVSQIGVALDNSNYVLVVLSVHSIRSVWVDKELSLALHSALDNKTLIVPLLIDNVPVPQQLRDLPYISFARTGYEVGCADLVRMLKRSVVVSGRLNLGLFNVWGEISVSETGDGEVVVTSDGETSGASGFTYSDPIPVMGYQQLWLAVSGTQNCDFTKWSTENQRMLKVHLNGKPQFPIPTSVQVSEDPAYICPVDTAVQYKLPTSVLDYGYIRTLDYIIGKGIFHDLAIRSWLE